MNIYFRPWLILVVVLFITVFSLLKPIVYNIRKVEVINGIKHLVEEKESYIITDLDSTTIDSIHPIKRMVNTLRDKYEVRFPHIVMAQFLLETDYLTSKVYKECNNICGMKYNTRGYATGVCRGHAEYKKPGDSVLDYIEYQKRYLPYFENKTLKRVATSEEDYYAFLNRTGARYAKDKNYTDKLKVIVDVINSL